MFATLITPAELAARLSDPAYVVVDVRHDLARPRATWGRRTSTRPGISPARASRTSTATLSAQKTGRNGRHPLPSRTTLPRCSGGSASLRARRSSPYDQGSGMFAARLWWMLRWLGHDAVAGGSTAASSAGRARAGR